MAKRAIDIDGVRAIALALPDVEESSIHGAPSWKVRGKLLTCPAIHSSAEPDTLAVRVDFDLRERLIAAEPRIFYVTDHYQKHPIVLVRLSRIDSNSLQDLLSMALSFVTSGTKATGRGIRKQSRGTAQ